MRLDRRIKIALDETRLLILGAQVLFGFLFESLFQNAFELGIAADVYVVFLKITHSIPLAIGASLTLLLAMLLLWYLYPIWLSMRRG